jgi:hypothetical protein
MHWTSTSCTLRVQIGVSKPLTQLWPTWALVILPDVAVGFIEQFLIRVQFVF